MDVTKIKIMQRNYIILDEKTDHVEYKLKVITDHIGTSYMLYRSNSELWSAHVRGKHVLTITDTGNNMIITPKLKKKVDYDVFSELFILISAMNQKESRLFQKYKLLEIENTETK